MRVVTLSYECRKLQFGKSGDSLPLSLECTGLCICPYRHRISHTFPACTTHTSVFSVIFRSSNIGCARLCFISILACLRVCKIHWFLSNSYECIEFLVHPHRSKYGLFSTGHRNILSEFGFSKISFCIVFSTIFL
jgi:hypothetical protein